MTDDQHGDQHGGGTPPSGGRWDPLPQGDYDDGATAFVKLPEGGVDALFASADSPLAAPGHGYVPPQITVAPATGTDPAATGTWGMPSAPVDGTQWHVPDAGPQQGGQEHGGQGYGGYPEYAAEYAQQDPYGQAAPYEPYDVDATQGDGFTYRPGATGQWDFSGADEGTGAAPPASAPGQDVTGQWSIPVADGDLPDESGEYTTSSLAEQWGGTAPATLPGGAPAPWATQATGQPWGDRAAAAGPGGEEQPAEDRPAATPHAPEPAAGPYAEAPAGPAVEVGPAGPTAGETVTGEPQGAEEAPGGPAEPSAGASGDVEPGSGPEAAEEPMAGSGPEAVEEHVAGSGPQGAEAPVTDPAPVAATGPDAAEEPTAGSDPETARERTPEPGREQGQEPGRQPEAEPPTDPAADPQAAQPDPAADPQAAEADPAADPQAGPAADSQERPLAAPHEDRPLASYVLRVNGADRPVTDAWIGESLLYVLRERLGLAGAKDGCSQGECGACNVQVDGRLVASCLVPAVTAAGSEVRTVEGLAADGQPSDVQRALARRGAVQCGFCVPGMAMTVHNLLEGNPAPTELEARQALCGNLCRCSGYRGVLEAVKEVVAEREAHAAADTPGTDDDEPRIPHQAGPGAGGVNPAAFEFPEPPGTPRAPGPHSQGPHSRGPHDQPFGDQPHRQDGGHA
ncbi:2Fe-2S iron-sulfur cluster-binding protein [Streptomyces lancefieldiae]|uniref:2Fe-2S iron-sulfur cluster-binding protein n=1 Tax=Streptomyces lancefieldiae TaxID=3075520 RepID=A0ABU3ASS6_9ACTN|nr:2Fe-2S iron-sulfur cluster-binding protein [Streptomyces sp. DSM 40712]MDT0613049.1 2Fe-2S iron-sulfur cluster-binding protein [Streptomyces sp. DSM 40712]